MVVIAEREAEAHRSPTSLRNPTRIRSKKKAVEPGNINRPPSARHYSNAKLA
jgi:hypothetical protein